MLDNNNTMWGPGTDNRTSTLALLQKLNEMANLGWGTKGLGDPTNYNQPIPNRFADYKNANLDLMMERGPVESPIKIGSDGSYSIYGTPIQAARDYQAAYQASQPNPILEFLKFLGLGR